MTQHLGIKDLLKHPPGLPSRHSSACRVLSTPCYLLCSPLCYPRISLKGAARYGKYVRSHWRTAAASLPFALPLAGTLNAAASMHGHSIAAAQHSPEEAEHGSLVGVDPRAPGENITVIHSPQELEDVLAAKSELLVCLMCKAIGCRPCKVFARKYQRIAKAYTDCVFLECTGDETIDLRKLMIQMGIRSTPTFRLYHRGECLKTHVGIDDQKLRAALDECLGRSPEPTDIADSNHDL